MNAQSVRRLRKGPIGRVGELLQNAHADCIEELAEFVIAYARINDFLHELKRTTRKVRSGKTLEQLDKEYHDLNNTLGADFERVSAEFLVADWPKSRPDVWDEHQATLRIAVTAFTERLVKLLAEYDPAADARH